MIFLSGIAVSVRLLYAYTDNMLVDTDGGDIPPLLPPPQPVG